MYIDVTGPGTVRFQWRVSSEANYDYLEFWIDSERQERISGEQTWVTKTYWVGASGTRRLKWRYVKDSGTAEGDDRGYVSSVTWHAGTRLVDELALAVDSGLTYTTGGHSGGWEAIPHDAYYGGSCLRARPGYPGQESYLQTTVSGAGTVKFYWRSWGEPYVDYLKFYVDDTWRAEITGWMEEWTEATYTISGTGTHTLKWLYTKSSEENCEGYVDWVRWSGSVPAEPAPDAWSTLNYVYDAQGRRIEKKYDGRTVLRYVYDGDHCIAEYDAGNNLKRKYIYGPGVDQPICMIEAAGSYAGTYYYHFDALGSVVALTNSSGNTVQVYEYDAYGRVGATDANHPNRIMFTGREFDKETGLYYYRARYYNPQIGRFLQTDPIGYGDGMNLYRYCGNNPIGHVDPSGRIMISSPFIASSSLMGRLWEIIKETYKTVFNPNPAPDGGEAVLVGGTSVVTYATVLEGIEENGLDYAGSEDYETLRGIPGRVATPHDPLDNACECDTCRRRREADNNGNNSNGPASSSDPQECPLHGADRCCVCGLCPCHCNYRWTGGWCTVLQKWPHEVNNREE